MSYDKAADQETNEETTIDQTYESNVKTVDQETNEEPEIDQSYEAKVKTVDQETYNEPTNDQSTESKEKEDEIVIPVAVFDDAKQQPPTTDEDCDDISNVKTPETIEKAFDILSSDEALFNWFSTVPKSNKMKTAEVKMDRIGNGGLKEVVEYLKSNVPFMRRAKLTPHLGEIAGKYSVVHLSKGVDEGLEGLDKVSLSKEFLRIGGGHKPQRYEYGTNQVYEVPQM